MKYGYIVSGGDAREVTELAQAAELGGWDGIFVWEPVWGVDAWVTLGAAAMVTERLRLGTMLTPLPRRKPWDLATQTATVDRLSGGRVVLSVGLGATHGGWTAFEADQGRRTRAELLDEGLDILFGLWRGQPFSYSGSHYTVTPTDFAVPDPPVQQPRIPTWCVGMAGARTSMKRAARCDGLIPAFRQPDGEVDNPTPEQLRAVVDEVHQLRSEAGLDGVYDVVVEGSTDPGQPDRAAAVVGGWADAGATWFLESNWALSAEERFTAQRARLEAGPPRI